MNQDGYTLAETLAALVMIGLAIGGLTAGVRVIGRSQAEAERHMAEGRRFEALQAALTGLFSGEGPFESTDPHGLVGDAQQFSFACAKAMACGAALSADQNGERLTIRGQTGQSAVRIAGVRAVRFSYIGLRQITTVWPPKGPDSDTLHSVIVLADRGLGEAPTANVRLWREHPLACAFDPISQTCRSVSP